jgi:hypothetical protein
MSRSQENIKVAPQEIFFAQMQTDCVEVAAETGTNLNSKYWLFSSPTVDYYVWYDVNNTGVNPALVGKTGIEVNVAIGASKAQVASAVATAIDAIAELSCIVDPKNSGRVILKVKEYAPGVHAANGDLGANVHNFVPVHDGFFHDFGFTDGDLEISMDQQLLDITAHQTGTEILTALVTGMNVELGVALKEISDENLQRLIEQTTGDAFTPVGGTKLQGYGSGQNFRNVLEKAGRLILHPAGKPRSEREDDLCAPLAYPKLDNITFSGENPQLINVTFRVFKDEFLPKQIDKVFLGDHTQV